MFQIFSSRRIFTISMILLLSLSFINPIDAKSVVNDIKLPEINESLFKNAVIDLEFSKYDLLNWSNNGSRSIGFYGGDDNRESKLWINIYTNEAEVIQEEFNKKKSMIFDRKSTEADRYEFNNETEYGFVSYIGYLDPLVPISGYYMRWLTENSFALVQLEYWGDEKAFDSDEEPLKILNQAIDFVDGLIKDELVLEGFITDSESFPLSNCRVVFFVIDKEPVFIAETVTDEDGYYKFKYNDNLEVDKQGIIIVTLEQILDGIMTFRILNEKKAAQVEKIFLLENEEDLNQNISFKEALKKDSDYKVPYELSRLKDYEAMYKHMDEAWDFFTNQVGWNLNYKLPVNVYTFSGKSTYYTPKSGDIVIGAYDSLITSPHRPMNREWHELAHHAMFSRYGRWPELCETCINHAGYLNPSTADSLIEGFAEFMSSAIADANNYPNPHLYRPIFNQEVNFKVWQYAGVIEEVAFSSLLWDLYDPTNDDMVDLSLGDITLVFGEYLPDITSFYNRLVNNHSSQAVEINQIFINHGFFADKSTGNSRFDVFEPFLDRNKNHIYDLDEFYIDYPSREFIYNGQDPIGNATNYQRPERRNLVEIPRLSILTLSTAFYYQIDIEYRDDASKNYSFIQTAIDGVLTLPILPQDENYIMRIKSLDGETGTPLVLDSSEILFLYDESFDKENLLEFNFNVIGNFSTQPGDLLENEDYLELEPYWDLPGIIAKDEDYIYNYEPEQVLSTFDSSNFLEKQINQSSVEKTINYGLYILIGFVIFLGIVLMIFRIKMKHN